MSVRIFPSNPANADLTEQDRAAERDAHGEPDDEQQRREKGKGDCGQDPIEEVLGPEAKGARDAGVDREQRDPAEMLDREVARHLFEEPRHEGHPYVTPRAFVDHSQENVVRRRREREQDVLDAVGLDHLREIPARPEDGERRRVGACRVVIQRILVEEADRSQTDLRMFDETLRKKSADGAGADDQGRRSDLAATPCSDDRRDDAPATRGQVHGREQPQPYCLDGKRPLTEEHRHGDRRHCSDRRRAGDLR